MQTSLTSDDLAPHADRLRAANQAFARRYPGEGGARQPVHTVYGGAQLFRHDSTGKLGQVARRALDDYAPDAATLARALGFTDAAFAEKVYARVAEKLGREPVEDFRIDFEDGYGNRPDAEEDGHAVSVAARGGEGARGRHAAALHRHPREAAERGAARPQHPHARPLPHHAGGGDRRRAAAQLRGHGAQGGAAGAGGVLRGRPAGARAPARAGRRHAPLRGHGRGAAGDPRRRRALLLPRAGARRGGPHHRRALRHLRLHGRRGHHRGAPAHAPPGVRLREARDAGVARRHRRVALRRLDHGDAGARPPRHAGRAGALRRAAGREPRRGAPRLEAALRRRAPLAGERLLPGVGPAPGAAGHALRRGLRLLPGERRRRGRPAEELRREGRAGHARRRRVRRRGHGPGAARTTSCAASTAARSPRRRRWR